MADYAVKRIDDMEAVYGGAYKRARAELGIEAFGMQVIDIPAGANQYPEHDHAEDGQEEVYIALRGDAELDIEGERVKLGPDTMIRVASGTMRKVWPGEEGVRLLIVGGCPGHPYKAPDVTKLGAPDPLTQQRA